MVFNYIESYRFTLIGINIQNVSLHILLFISLFSLFFSSFIYFYGLILLLVFLRILYPAFSFRDIHVYPVVSYPC
jgi:hypothetical protein